MKKSQLSQKTISFVRIHDLQTEGRLIVTESHVPRGLIPIMTRHQFSDDIINHFRVQQ